MAVKDASAVLPCWTTDFTDRNSCDASSCAKAPFSPAATVSGAAVVSAPAAAYCCCCQANKNACVVGSAESSEPKPTARPMTSTPTATMASAAMRDRFARRIAGEDLRPGLPAELGATWRADRLPPGASRAGLAARGGGVVPFRPGAPPMRSCGPVSRPGGLTVSPGAPPVSPGTPPISPGPPRDTADQPGRVGDALLWAGVQAGRGAVLAGRPVLAGGPGAPSSGRPGPRLSRGLGAKRPRGLAWPPRSFAGGDTIRLPVTFAVSGLGPFPWPHHVLPGPGACRRSACRGRGPAPP